VERDDELADEQFKIILEQTRGLQGILAYKLYLELPRENSECLTTYRIPPKKRLVLHQFDCILFSDSEAILIEEIKCKKRNKAEMEKQTHKDDPKYLDPRESSWKEEEFSEKPDEKRKKSFLVIAFVFGQHVKKRYPIDEDLFNDKLGGSITFGRDPYKNVIVYESKAISLEHARIEYDETMGWYLEETKERGSANGTYLSVAPYFKPPPEKNQKECFELTNFSIIKASRTNYTIKV